MVKNKYIFAILILSAIFFGSLNFRTTFAETGDPCAVQGNCGWKAGNPEGGPGSCAPGELCVLSGMGSFGCRADDECQPPGNCILNGCDTNAGFDCNVVSGSCEKPDPPRSKANGTICTTGNECITGYCNSESPRVCACIALGLETEDASYCCSGYAGGGGGGGFQICEQNPTNCVGDGAECYGGASDVCCSAGSPGYFECKERVGGSGNFYCDSQPPPPPACVPQNGACGNNSDCCAAGGLECIGGSCIPKANCLPGFCGDSSYTGPVLDLQSLLKTIYQFLFPLGLGIGGFFIVLSGYKIMTSEGNPTKTKEGSEELLASITGTLFIALAMTLLRVIINTFIGKANF